MRNMVVMVERIKFDRKTGDQLCVEVNLEVGGS